MAISVTLVVEAHHAPARVRLTPCPSSLRCLSCACLELYPLCFALALQPLPRPCRRTHCPRIPSQPRAYDLDLIDRGRVAAPAHFRACWGEQPIAEFREATANDNHFRAEKRNHVGQSDPDSDPGAFQYIARLHITRVGGLRDNTRRDFADVVLREQTNLRGDPLQDDPRARRRDRGTTRDGFQTADIATAAAWSVRVDGLVAELCRDAVQAHMQPPIDDQPAADPGSQREAGHESRALARAEGRFCERERPRIIDQVNRRAERRVQVTNNRLLVPVTGQVRHEHRHPARIIDHCRDADANRANLVQSQPGLTANRANRLRNPRGNGIRSLVRLRRHSQFTERLLLFIEQHRRDFCAAEVNSYYHHF